MLTAILNAFEKKKRSAPFTEGGIALKRVENDNEYVHLVKSGN